jgi:hypothetical protein
MKSEEYTPESPEQPDRHESEVLATERQPEKLGGVALNHSLVADPEKYSKAATFLSPARHRVGATEFVQLGRALEPFSLDRTEERQPVSPGTHQ